MKARILAVVCTLVFFISCHKDQEEYPIIYPGSYFPVYPGSWWKYMTWDNSIITHSVNPTYKLDKYVTWDVYNDGHKAEYSDPCYVPFYDGQPIYGYDKIDKGEAAPFATCYKRWPILSEQTGFSFQKEWVDHRYITCYEVVGVMGKYFNGTDSILVQKIKMIPCPVDLVTIQEFAKNIGLIKQFSYDTITFDTVSKIWLIDYYVSFDSTSVE